MATLPQLIEEDIRGINAVVDELLRQSEATMAILIDKGGFVITQSGQVDEFDTVTFGALGAASFAATESIAGLAGERNFSSVYQQGDSKSVLVMNVDEYSLLAIVFRAQISVGAVKYFALPTIKKIAAQLQVALERNPATGLDLSMLNVADPSHIFLRQSA